MYDNKCENRAPIVRRQTRFSFEASTQMVGDNTKKAPFHFNLKKENNKIQSKSLSVTISIAQSTKLCSIIK